MKLQTVHDAIPEWDGQGSTALQWFAAVQEFANAGGYVPYQLGYHLWSRLKEGSAVRSWYMTLTPDWKAWMRRYYTNFLSAVQHYYLGRTWKQDRHAEYVSQAFRQPGHARETPTQFVQRRLAYTRMLLPQLLGLPDEVREVMRAAPVVWCNILNSDQIPSVMELQSRVVEMENQLLATTDSTGSHVMSRETFARLMRAYEADSRSHRQRSANLVSSEGGSETHDADPTVDGPTSDGSSFTDHPVIVECYALAKKRQRPPPKGGYPFTKKDDVVSTLRPPPSPCKCCGSAKHWDRECPWYHTWEKKFGRGKEKAARNSETRVEDEEFDDMYSTAFDELNTQASLSLYLDPRVKSSLAASATLMESVAAASPQPQSRQALAIHSNVVSKGPGVNRRATVEDWPEEVEILGPFAEHYLIEDELGQGDESQRYGSPELSSPDVVSANANESSNIATDAHLSEEPTQEVAWLKPRRYKPSGSSALGVSVLSIRGRVNDPGGPEVDLRLDSGADITLVSAEFYASLVKPPKLRKGRKMEVWQLTDRSTRIEGFIELPLFIASKSGELLGVKAEAYVVPNMNVPLLLGEDFHVAYELTVERHLEFGTTVRFGPRGPAVEAQGVRKPSYPTMVEDTSRLAAYVKAKLHRRNQTRKRKRRLAEEKTSNTARVASSIRIPPHSCVNVPVDCSFERSDVWLVEKGMVGDERVAPLVLPNVLLTADYSRIPVSNTTSKSRYLKKGEVLADLVDPREGLDQPRSTKEWVEMSNNALRIAALVRATQRSQSDEKDRVFWGKDDGSFVEVEAVETSTQERKDPETTHGVVLEEDEDWGPKTAEVPDPNVYSSEDMEKLIDVADVPEELREKVWEMLRRRVKAFGFDGRLGHLETKCRIRTKEGVEPVSVPMYSSSPAKRQVIDAQLNTWFEQGVIEPSHSPWGAPVVIVYRNGKARFCVDYRKLNAQTVPDEFPLPRQSEILSALSGAQVLSSLDALSGFTQIELAEEDVEKTAFRTHRGLFQFRRMPFGLKNGPSIFQRTMQSILAPYLWLFTLVYIDDIVVYSKTYEEHLEHLDKVLEAIEKAGLTLSPKKCHLFYGSILLLGHKVSRLGLSTHEEKVRAISELKRPTKLSELQMFLGMVVYFSTFIPYYASIASPLFRLLRKGTAWRWGPEEEHTFEAAKAALKAAPVLGHPIEGRPYRLYTDASDEAIGCCLQQVQPILAKDLAGTKAYEKLVKAHQTGQSVPKFVTKLSNKTEDHTNEDIWGDSVDDTTVHVERVLAYWSRTLKNAETRYSATEREALGAKEGLVRFQPYIEGERILLVTDHAALQWAKTYENANRRLAAWGAIYSAFAPGLEIIHRPGRVHSNVDPLSRLPRAPPEYVAPLPDRKPALRLDSEKAGDMEARLDSEPARRATFGGSIELRDWDELLIRAEANPVRRSKRLAKQDAPATDAGGGSREELHEPPEDKSKAPSTSVEESTSVTGTELDPYESKKLWEATHRPPTVLVEMEPHVRDKYVAGYKEDITFRAPWERQNDDPDSWDPANRYFKDSNDLLYFRDADFHARLCVPKGERLSVLREAHESPHLTAHAGPEKLWEYLSSRCYWPRMKTDILEFCSTCDVCQKTKPSNFSRYGKLLPHSIPTRPYESISMDLIVNLPWSNDCNAILVFVDRLTKHSQFIPTTTGLNAEGFALLFVKHIVCKFGVPASIVTDRDPRWTSIFWREVAKILKSDMILASSHHPQHDGQTEIVNRQLETMLRAYVKEDRESWCDWIPLLEHAYNAKTHAATGSTPYFLLYGFEPRSTLDLSEISVRAIERSKETDTFLKELQMHRESARRSIARAQAKQAAWYNKGRKVVDFEPGDLVLVNPHKLEWVESTGVGKKLVQRWIGPFEVQQRINDNTYRLRLNPSYPGNPIFNIEHLKGYKRSPEEFGERTKLDDTRAAPEGEVYELEKIIGHKYDKRRRTMTYLVRWAGYSPLYDEWKTAKELSGAPELLHAYRLNKGL